MHVRSGSETVTVTRQVYGRVSSLTVSKGLLRACKARKDVGKVSVANGCVSIMPAGADIPNQVVIDRACFKLRLM
jgi:hypothetical protein